MAPVEQVRARLRPALRAAMVARDRPATAAIRGALAALDDAESVPAAGHEPSVGHLGEAARRRLTAADVTRILAGELEEHQRAAALYRELGDTQTAAAMQARADAVAPFVADPGTG